MTFIYSLDALDKTAKTFADNLSPGVIAMHGEMGAGKTTFIAAVCRQLGVDVKVGSPTFSVINEYQANNAEPVYHMDLYRLKDENEARDAGVEEYFYSGHFCFVEWPEQAPLLLPENTVHCYIETVSATTRKMRIIQ